MCRANNFSTRVSVFIFIAAIALGCRFEASTAENVVVDKVRPANSSPTPANYTLNQPVVQPTPTVVRSANAACPHPDKPCHHADKRFDEWELPFRLPAKLKSNTPYKSEKFYAVILKTYPMSEECDGGEFISSAEADRKREQANQLERKVFASYECPNMSAVNYEFDGRWDSKKENIVIGNFIAIYVGTTKTEAEQAFSFFKKDYPNAKLKQMTASYEVIEQ